MAGSLQAASSVVINEIMYHPVEDRDGLQYIELLNAGVQAVNLSGWTLTNAVHHRFAHGTVLNAGACLVVCANVASFRQHYGQDVVVGGVFAGRLSHRRGTLALLDNRGVLVDSARYEGRPPWPLAADGYGSSLERLCPSAPGDNWSNWDPSTRRVSGVPEGTPGRPNTGSMPHPPPTIWDIVHSPAAPERPISIRARVSDSQGVAVARLDWATNSEAAAWTWHAIPMTRLSDEPTNSIFSAELPAQKEGALIRFRVAALNVLGVERLWPSPKDVRPTLTLGTFKNTNDAQIPMMMLLTHGAAQPTRGSRRARTSASLGEALTVNPESAWGNTVVYMPPSTPEVWILDHVQIRSRKGGLKVQFHQDQLLEGLRGVNLIFEGSPRYVLAEYLAYEVYRRAGVLTPASWHVRLSVNDRPVGYQLLVEQPNASFLRRHGREPDGNLYKLIWYGQGVTGQHEKKGHSRPEYEDLLALIDELRGTSDQPVWDSIQQHFNVDALLAYCAVSMCIQNWDGFWNNYFAYHDLRPGGKWELIPWDEDKTWGDRDGMGGDYDWYSMPLTFGMKGDRPGRRSWFSSGSWSPNSWWRPPGYFTGPLLAQPDFRRRFLGVLREFCTSLFTPEVMGPVIRELERRLEPEIPVWAGLRHVKPGLAMDEFRRNIQSFHNQLDHRRNYLLQQLDAVP